MTAHLQLLALDRLDATERLVVSRLDDLQRHAVEIAEERRTIDGWELRRRVVVQLGEIHLVHGAISRACSLAGAVRR